MVDREKLAEALGLEAPWRLGCVEVSPRGHSLHIGMTFPDEGTFPCPQCGALDCAVELTRPRVWHHESFLGYRAFVMARRPDLGCTQCGIVPAPVSWERPEAGFALLTLGPARPAPQAWLEADDSAGVSDRARQLLAR